MRFAAREAIEQRLPSRYWGKRGHRRLLRDVPLRISVSGVRGKSGLTRMTHDVLRRRGLHVYAKVTGTEAQSIRDGEVHPILRDEKRFDMVRETMWETKRHWPMEALVLENQAIHPETMRAFNELLAMPHYLLVTNIRHDHLGDLARRLEVMALQFGRSAPRGSLVICGESNPSLRRLVEKGTHQAGARFLAAPPPDDAPPGSEAITMLDALLAHHFGQGHGLASGERTALYARLDARFRWHDSALPGIRWFHGAEINDIDSTALVRDRLQTRQRLPITYVAYFRRDRLDRTATFVPFLQDALDRSDARAVVLCGHRANVVARRLRATHAAVHVVHDDPSNVPAVVTLLRDIAAGGGVLTVANAVPPWPKALAEALAIPNAANGTPPQTQVPDDPRNAPPHPPVDDADETTEAAWWRLPGQTPRPAPSISSGHHHEGEVTPG